MKSLCILFAVMVIAVKGYSQTAVIAATPSFNNAERTGLTYRSSSIADSIFNQIHILPNLAAGRITIIIDDAKTEVIQQGECIVYNNSGYPVASKAFTTGTNDIFVNNMPAGMYFVRLIQKNGEVALRKFVVSR